MITSLQFLRHSTRSKRICLGPFLILAAFSLCFHSDDLVAQPISKPELPEKENETAPPATTNFPDRRASYDEAMIPDYFIAGVAIEAEVLGERINLEAEVEIVVNREIGWIKVPLRFDQAHIWSREYSGPGEEAPSVSAQPDGEGVSWLLKGKGKHRLKFSMWAPYRRSIIGSRFQLTLPPLADQFDTKLKLKIPDGGAILRVSPHLDVLEVERNRGQSIFNASVSKNRLDLIWSVPVGNAQKVSKVSTKFHLKPNSESISLIADQSIELQQQAPEDLYIRLPSEFELLTQEVNQQTVEELIDRPGWVRVKVPENISSTLQLHWEFSKPLSQAGERVSIDGLEVEGATQEGGSLRIDGLQGYRIVPRLSDSRLVYRVGNIEQSMNSSDSPNSLFEFLQQPFKMAFDVLPIEPLHSTTLIHALQVEPSQMVLDVHQLIDVERGSLNSFELLWPGYQEEEWKFDRVTSPSLSLGALSWNWNESGDRLSVSMTRPVESGERVHLICRFTKPISLDQSPKLQWSLPDVEDRSARGKILSLGLSDSIELNFDKNIFKQFSSGISSGHLSELSDRWQLPEAFAQRLNAPHTYLLNHLDNNRLSAVAQTHLRDVEIKTTLEVLEATPRDLLLVQKFDLDIRYGRINSLELKVPEELQQIMEPAGIETGMSITFEGEPLTLNTIAGVPRLTFPTGIIGKKSFELKYRYPIDPQQGKQSVKLPLINLNQEIIQQISCLITPVENVQLVTDKSTWMAAETSPLGPFWVRKNSHSDIGDIEVLIGGSLSDSTQQYLVEKAQFWTQFEEDGRAKTFSRFDVLSPPSRIVMTFPENSDFIVSVDGERLAAEAVTRSADGSGEIVIQLPDRLEDRRIIEFQYLTGSPNTFALAARRKFEFPQFAKSVWVNETVWEIQLPYGFHIFEYPHLKPLFTWVRSGVIWQREPTPIYQMKRAGVKETLPESFQFSENFYAFRGFSPVSIVEFRAMNRSLILLIGAGFALTLGFLFYRFPVTRHVFSLVVLAFCFAVASVWYLEPMLLLIQPAVIGVLLALTATVIDVRSRRTPPRSRNLQNQDTTADERLSTSKHGVAEGTTRIYAPMPQSGSDLSRE